MKNESNFHENFDTYLPLDEFIFKIGLGKYFFFYSVDFLLFHFMKSEQNFMKSEQNILKTYYLKNFLNIDILNSQICLKMAMNSEMKTAKNYHNITLGKILLDFLN